MSKDKNKAAKVEPEPTELQKAAKALKAAKKLGDKGKIEQAEAHLENVKKANFKRLAQPRINIAVKRIKMLENLGTSQYSHTSEQAEVILTALRKAIDRLEEKFSHKKHVEDVIEL